VCSQGERDRAGVCNGARQSTWAPAYIRKYRPERLAAEIRLVRRQIMRRGPRERLEIDHSATKLKLKGKAGTGNTWSWCADRREPSGELPSILLCHQRMKTPLSGLAVEGFVPRTASGDLLIT
jgi:hypothetical protein